MNNINLNKLVFCKADKDMIKYSFFDCGDLDLNEFFLKDSFLNIDNNLSKIYACKYDEKIVAFFSLSADSIKINDPLEVSYPQYPAIKIGRLGVHKDYQNNSIGTMIIYWVIGFCREIRKDIGVRFISVDAYNDEQVINFYKNNLFIEFNEIKDKKNDTIQNSYVGVSFLNLFYFS